MSMAAEQVRGAAVDALEHLIRRNASNWKEVRQAALAMIGLYGEANLGSPTTGRR